MDRFYSPAEIFLLHRVEFSRWKSEPSLFVYPAFGHPSLVWAAVCDLENAAATEFTLTVQQIQSATAALHEPGLRVEATFEGLFTAMADIAEQQAFPW